MALGLEGVKNKFDDLVVIDPVEKGTAYFQGATICKLPDKILVNVFSRLNTQSLIACKKVNMSFYKIARHVETAIDPMAIFSIKPVQGSSFIKNESGNVSLSADSNKLPERRVIEIEIVNEDCEAQEIIVRKKIEGKWYDEAIVYYPIKNMGRKTDSLNDLEIKEGCQLNWKLSDEMTSVGFDEEINERLNRWLIHGWDKCIETGPIESPYVKGHMSNYFSCVQFVLYVICGITHFSGSNKHIMELVDVKEDDLKPGDMVLICKAGDKSVTAQKGLADFTNSPLQPSKTVEKTTESDVSPVKYEQLHKSSGSHTLIYIGGGIYLSARPGGKIYFQNMSQLEKSWIDIKTSELEYPLVLKKVKSVNAQQREDGSLEAVENMPMP